MLHSVDHIWPKVWSDNKTRFSLVISEYGVVKPAGSMKIPNVSNSFEFAFMLILGDNSMLRIDDLAEAL